MNTNSSEEWRTAEIETLLNERISDENTSKRLAKLLFRGSESALEFDDDDPSFQDWFDNRLKCQFVWLERDDYSRALVRALWLAPVFAGTDFGSSRQRDMGQVWTDTARGFLGEIALSKFFAENFQIQTRLDYHRGDIEKFLPMDISQIKRPYGDWTAPSLKISVKATKFNGRWLDVPGVQVDHSDVFVLSKLGVERHHFLAFLKAISFLRDKLFPNAKKLGELNNENAQELWDEIPEFDPIPAYISGFVNKANINFPIHMINARIKGRKYIRLVVSQGVGLFTPDNIRSNPEILRMDPSGSLPIDIEPIIKSYTGTKFLAHSGGLEWGKDQWRDLVNQL